MQKTRKKHHILDLFVTSSTAFEKAFQKDSSIKRIDVDLSKGKVLLAYSNGVEIDFNDIKKKILANGQNATGMKVLKI